MPVAGEIVQLNPDGTVPEGAIYNPAVPGVAFVIAGGILDTGVPTPPSEQDTTSVNEGGLSFDDFYREPQVMPEPKPEPEQTTLEAMQGVYVDKLGRTGTPENVINWVNAVNSGQMTFEEAVAGIANSPEGQAYAASQAAGADDAVTGGDTNDTIIDAGTPDPEPDDPEPITPTTDFNPLIQQYYQELFNRQAQQPGLDYFTGRLTSGALTEDALRDAIISGATGTDRLYYDASQSGGPVFDATQALFGRRPARGIFNPETGQLEGGFGAYRSRLDAGQLTEDQLRRNLVQLAYDRGEGGGQSADYQNYLNTLRGSIPEGAVFAGGSPFFDEATGTYRNIPYGSDLTQLFPTDTEMPAPPPSGGIMDEVSIPSSFDPDNVYKTIPYPGYVNRGGLGKGGGGFGRMPGQYITGNPYNMMFAPIQPFNYGFSSQYMPNRGLMSGYSTGFGPYGGYQRPRFGGGKGGFRTRPIYPMGGGKGGFGGGFG